MGVLSALAGWKGYAAVGGACLIVGFGGGYKLRSLIADHDALKVQKAATAAAVRRGDAIQKAAVITQDVGTKVEARQVEIRTVTRTLVEKVPVYVTAKADASCPIPVGFVRLHDAAAAGSAAPVPDGSGESLDAPSGLALSAVSSTLVENYGTCRQWREQVIGWQDWYAAQRAAWPTK